MASRLVLDTVEGAILDLMATSGTIVRTGTVTEIDASIGPDSDVLLAAVFAQDMPRLGQDTYPGQIAFIFTRLQARGFCSNGLSVSLIYETTKGLIPTAFIVRDRSYMSSRSMTRLPGMGPGLGVFRVGFAGVDTDHPDHSDYQPAIPKDVVSMELLSPLRAISVVTISVGSPPNAGRTQHGTVNNAPWPTPPPSWNIGGGPNSQGIDLSGNSIFTTPPLVGSPLPAGFWLLHVYQTEYTRQLNYFQSNLEAITRSVEDWSELAFLRSNQTGKWAAPPTSAIDAAMSAPYSYGVQPDDANGLLRICPYKTSNFSSLFGF